MKLERNRCGKCGGFLGKKIHICNKIQICPNCKGILGRVHDCNKVREMRKELYKKNEKFQESRIMRKGELHPLWKGNNVKYQGCHRWIRKYKPKLDKCEFCGSSKKLDVACINNYKQHNRNIKDYKWLCRSCHEIFDNTRRIKIDSDEIVSIEVKKCNEFFWDIQTETKNFIANDIITHNCYPSKRSIATGIYTPSYLKERVEVLVAIDTSGSIGQTELTEFISEVVGLAKAYQDRIEMRLLTHDVDVQNDYLLENGVTQKVQQLKIKGGGGTSHFPILEHIKKKYKDTKLAIFLTDGCSDLQNINLRDYPFRKLIILNKYGLDAKQLQLNDDTKVIKLK
jgi:hypothetical protein